MIHNSYDFTMSETSQIAKIDQDQNPSWINLRCLKDVIRMSSDRIQVDNKSYFLNDKGPTISSTSSDQDEVQDINRIDTPQSSNTGIPDNKNQFQENKSLQSSRTGENQFKRKNRQITSSQYSLSSDSQNSESEMNVQQAQKPKLNHQYKNSCQIQHNRNQSTLIDLTKKSMDNFSIQQQTKNQMKVFEVDALSDNKENQNPYKLKRKNTQQYDTDKSSNNDTVCLRIIDKELDQFCERVDKIKKSLNPLSTREEKINRLSYSYQSSRQKSKSTPRNSGSPSLDLSQTSVRSSSLKLRNKVNYETKQNEVTSQGQQANDDQKKNFKRKNKTREQSSDMSEIDENAQRQNVIALRKENQRLKRQLDQQQKDHEQELKTLKEQQYEHERQQMKEIEEENLLIIDGIKQEYEEKINELQEKIDQIQKQNTDELERAILEYESKIETKKDKYKKEKAQMQNLIEDQINQIEALKNQIFAIKNSQQQQNIFRTQDCQNSKYEEIIQRNQNKLNYFSERSSKNNMFRNDSDDENPQQYLSLDNFIAAKQKAFFNHDISNIAPQHPYNNYYSQSQQEDSAMNFSFSDVKNSVDKSALFEKNMMILYTENQHNILEKVSQEDNEDEDYMIKQRPQQQQIDLENIDCEDNSDDDYQSPNGMGPSTSSQKNRLLYSNGDGSENAPEDSGFVSDENEYQERIVNESSLESCDDMLMMTGRSESAIDEDDEVQGLSKCKAINSSYINLKRNNLLISYEKK